MKPPLHQILDWAYSWLFPLDGLLRHEKSDLYCAYSAERLRRRGLLKGPRILTLKSRWSAWLLVNVERFKPTDDEIAESLQLTDETESRKVRRASLEWARRRREGR